MNETIIIDTEDDNVPSYYLDLQGKVETNTIKVKSKEEGIALLYKKTDSIVNENEVFEVDIDHNSDGNIASIISGSEFFQSFVLREENNKKNIIESLLDEILLASERADIGLTQYAYELEDTYCCSKYLDQIAHLVQLIKKELKSKED